MNFSLKNNILIRMNNVHVKIKLDYHLYLFEIIFRSEPIKKCNFHSSNQ